MLVEEIQGIMMSTSSDSTAQLMTGSLLYLLPLCACLVWESCMDSW